MYDQYRLPQVRDPNRLIINFHMQRQIMDHWCWAAAASSVSFHLDEFAPKTQKEIVAQAFGLDVDKDLDEEWDQDFRIDLGLGIVDCLQATHNFPVSFRDVLRQLESDRPVIAHIDWGNDTAHAIAISGCWMDGQGIKYLQVEDPRANSDGMPIPMPMKAVLEDYFQEGGKWRHSFFVEKPQLYG